MRSQPLIEIQIRLEERPVIHLVATSHEDEQRIRDWIDSQPALQQLVQEAQSLREAA